MKKSEIINILIEKNNYKSYLEIGLDNPLNNYAKIICDRKVSVDPYVSQSRYLMFKECIDNYLTYKLTSDEFFAQNNETFDIIFLDGLHYEEQLDRDIQNSMKVLNPGGVIVCHDCLPPNEIRQLEYEEFKSDGWEKLNIAWNGSCWKSIAKLSELGVNFYTVDADEGCAVIPKNDLINKFIIPKAYSKGWDYFERHRNSLMHVISPQEFEEKMK